jgi:hypothetical protein
MMGDGWAHACGARDVTELPADIDGVVVAQREGGATSRLLAARS